MSRKFNEQIRQNCIKLFKPAKELLKAEYTKSDRVKLTHYWLAQQLNIPNFTAFVLLAMLARYKVYCVRIPDGPIYWDNEKVNLNEVLKTLQKPRVKSDIPRRMTLIGKHNGKAKKESATNEKTERDS